MVTKPHRNIDLHFEYTDKDIYISNICLGNNYMQFEDKMLDSLKEIEQTKTA